MDDCPSPVHPGDYVDIHWTDEEGPQSAAGFFEYWDENGYLCLDWGYAVSRFAPDFRVEVVSPPVCEVCGSPMTPSGWCSGTVQHGPHRDSRPEAVDRG